MSTSRLQLDDAEVRRLYLQEGLSTRQIADKLGVSRYPITIRIRQWCDMSKVKASTVRQRFYGYKWPIEKALELEKVS